MKLIFISFLSCLGIHTSTYCQSSITEITVKEGMMEEYNQAFYSLHPLLQKVIVAWDSMEMKHQEEPGYIKSHHVYVTRFQIDTLNVDNINLPDLSSIKILAINGVPYEEKEDSEYEEWNRIRQDFWGYWTDIDQDTLIINMSGLMDWWDLTFKIYNQEITAYYTDATKYDTIFKANLQDEYSKSVTLPVTVNKFYVNQSTFEPGDEIIGFASCRVAPYYIYNYDDKEHPFHVQHTFDLYFRVLALDKTY